MDAASSTLSSVEVTLLDDLRLRLTSIGLVIDCEVCGSAVVLSFCQTDRNGNAGKPMARHSRCNFFRWFPSLLSYPHILSLITSPSPPLVSDPSSSSSTSSQLVGASDKKTRRRGAQCIGPLCRRSAALRCALTMCLSHCQEVGGCAFHGSHPPSGGQDPPPPREEVPPEPSQVIDLGMEQLQKAIAQELASFGLPYPEPTPQRCPSYHELLTSSAAVLPEPPLSQLPLVSSPPFTPNAISVPDPSPPTADPSTPLTSHAGRPHRITHQLDQLWFTDLNERARREADEHKVAERRREMEKAAKQRFILYWYDANDVPVKRQCVTNCPCFPQYCLSDDPVLLARLGCDISIIEVFEERWHGWITADVNYTFTVESQSHIFVRRAGITTCLDFDEHLKASHESTRPAHIRTNIKAERDGVRAKIKARSGQLSMRQRLMSEVDSEGSPSPLRPTHKRQRSPMTPASSHSASDIEIIDNLPSPPRTQQHRHSSFTPSPHASRSLSPGPSTNISSVVLSPGPSTNIPSVVPVAVPEYRGRVWPWGMYTIDMVQGFKQLTDKKLLREHSQPILFELVFGVPFVKPTFYGNLKAWTKPYHALLEQSERAGRTQAGLWSTYLATRREALGERSKVKVRRMK